MIGEEDAEAHLRQIVKSLDAEHAEGKQRLFSRKYLFPVSLAILVVMFNQLAGINAILYYLNDIFARAGFTKISADLQAVVIGATNLLFTVVAMTVIDRLGRKRMLLIGSVGTFACLVMVSYLFYDGRHEDLLIWPVICYIAFFAFSQGAVIWVYISEVFPNSVRAKGQSLGSFTHWFMAAILSWAFPFLSAHSATVPFMFFAVMMVVQFFVVLFVFPETKGITLEDMQKKLGIE